ncbi:MAG TPA: FAD-binding protein [Polyangiales bacterium]|nr:FAD-binding protein [Polyangiales bacterium]
MPQPLIEIDHNRVWRNWHDTDGVGGQVQQFFTPSNEWIDNTAIDPAKQFAAGLAGLCAIVQKAEAANVRLRALGSGWSLNSVGFVDGFLVNTSRLTAWSIGLSAKSVAPECAAIAERVVYAQCGTQITTLNSGLEARGLALPTSGASNGQTIAGAISTGTHGSAHKIGSLHDRVLALHIVAEHGKHYVIQSARRPVVTQAYCTWLGAELRQDDALFDAALVSFGSFGIVHAVIFEASPLYLLRLCAKQLDYTDIAHAAASHDISKLQLLTGAGDPYHIEFVINPYLRGAGQKGAFVRVYYEQAHKTGDALPVIALTGATSLRGRDLVGAISFGAELAPGVIPSTLQSQLADIVPTALDGEFIGTPGQCFSDSLRTGGGTSLELGVPLERVGDALAAVFAVTDVHTFGAPVALRYVRASQALLAFTHFAPITCTIELPGIDAPRSREAHRLLEIELVKRAVPHTYHWGQVMPLNHKVVRAGFGDARVDAWLEARRGFLSEAGRKLFSNDMLDALGLAA